MLKSSDTASSFIYFLFRSFSVWNKQSFKFVSNFSKFYFRKCKTLWKYDMNKKDYENFTNGKLLDYGIKTVQKET